MIKRKKILVAPLDWGLGHATRCIPIIQYLVQANCEVFIASSGSSQKILEACFPELNHMHLEGYRVNYAKSNVQLNFISQIPKIFSAIKKEKKWVDKIIEDHAIDALISDNRYGLYSKEIPTAIITHQLNIQGPKLIMKKMNSLVEKYLVQFSECWVPDFEGDDSFAGKLSQRKENFSSIKYLGPLSRFTKQNRSKGEEKYAYLGIVSGPENQRTIFEKTLLKAFLKTEKKSLLICGLPQEDFCEEIGNVTRVSHLQTEDFAKAVSESKRVICRAGYSTIMDLISLGKSAVLVPTPGQTEQEYLANYLNGKHGFLLLQQKEIKNKLKEIAFSSSSDITLEFNNMAVIQSFLDKL